MSRRTDAVRRVLVWLVRGALLALWALVGWGTLLLLVTAAGAVGEGPGVALGRLLPTPGASLWAWLNGGAAALALVVWLIVLGLFVRSGGSFNDPPP
ncbi:MAG: hypothetical protein LJF15_07950 [Acidobacteria bacterium]|nr:hypothetical protein [Acidobacteriota bacterium]